MKENGLTYLKHEAGTERHASFLGFTSHIKIGRHESSIRCSFVEQAPSFLDLIHNIASPIKLQTLLLIEYPSYPSHPTFNNIHLATLDGARRQT
jgi:hypothetical protein